MPPAMEWGALATILVVPRLGGRAHTSRLIPKRLNMSAPRGGPKLRHFTIRTSRTSISAVSDRRQYWPRSAKRVHDTALTTIESGALNGGAPVSASTAAQNHRWPVEDDRLLGGTDRLRAQRC